MIGSRVAAAAVLVFALGACGDESLPAAADGTNLDACSDGSCEVLVDSGDVVEVPELGPIEIAIIEDDMLEVASRSDDGQGNTSELSASGVAGQRLQLNEQVFTVVAVLGQQGVLRVGD